MQDWIADHKARGIQPVLANPSRTVLAQLEHAAIPELIGREYVSVRIQDAVSLCQVCRWLCFSRVTSRSAT